MQNKLLLEGICAHVDEKVSKNKNINADIVLEEYGLPKTEIYSDFVSNYIKLAEDYELGKESCLESDHEMNLERVLWNSILGGFLGYQFEPKKYTGPAGALVGCLLTAYDEAKNVGLNLSYSFGGILLGGMVGAQYDNEWAYAGAAIGAGIGLAKTIKDCQKDNKKKIENQNTLLRKLEDKYAKRKKNLISAALPQLTEAQPDSIR